MRPPCTVTRRCMNHVQFNLHVYVAKKTKCDDTDGCHGNTSEGQDAPHEDHKVWVNIYSTCT